MKNHKKAFTLAEVLTTLMVIGIVAALTIPSMINNYKKRETATKLKKFYAETIEIIKRIPVEEGCPAGDYECAGFLVNANTNAKLFTKHFKSIKKINLQECGKIKLSGAVNGCYASPNGAIFSFTAAVMMDVDINGDAPPNQRGSDQFRFRLANKNQNGITKGTVLPWGSMLLSQYLKNNNNLHWSNKNAGSSYQCLDDREKNTWGCAGRIIETGSF